MRISIDTAIQMIKDGEVVAAPTETVYGLAASIEHPKAIEQIFALKKRPANNPLITHVATSQEVRDFADELPRGFEVLAEAFWPGPLTLVIPIKEGSLSSIIRAGLPKAAFRVPDHPLIQALINGAGPIVMPSANLSGKPSSTKPEHVELDFGAEFPVLDGGICEKGIESTVLIAEEGVWKIGRLGSITAEQIEEVLGYSPELPDSEVTDKPLCPGQMYRHYAPKARLHLCGSIPDQCSVVLGFSDRTYHPAKVIKVLGSLDDPGAVAKSLYQVFRELDEEGIIDAWVDMDFPNTGLWVSIRERIKKAAAQ